MFDGGVLQVEIDLIQKRNLNSDDIQFYVSHSYSDVLQDKYSQQNLVQSFPQVLQDLKEWQQENKNHLPIIVTLDFKDDSYLSEQYGKIVEQLNQQILENIGRGNIYSNQDFMNRGSGGNNNLFDQLQQQGWPRIQELLGKIIFTISGSDSHYKVKKVRDTFSNLELNKISFVDIDSRSIQDLDENYVQNNKNRIIYNFSLKKYMDQQQQVMNQVYEQKFLGKQFSQEQQLDFVFQEYLKQAQQYGFLIRAYGIKGKRLWELAKDFKVNIISTSDIFGKKYTSFLRKEDFQ